MNWAGEIVKQYVACRVPEGYGLKRAAVCVWCGAVQGRRVMVSGNTAAMVRRISTVGRR